MTPETTPPADQVTPPAGYSACSQPTQTQQRRQMVNRELVTTARTVRSVRREPEDCVGWSDHVRQEPNIAPLPDRHRVQAANR